MRVFRLMNPVSVDDVFGNSVEQDNLLQGAFAERGEQVEKESGGESIPGLVGRREKSDYRSASHLLALVILVEVAREIQQILEIDLLDGRSLTSTVSTLWQHRWKL